MLTGYICLGIAYGVLMRTAGYGLGWAVLLSVICYAGSMEFVTVTLLTSAFDPIQALIMVRPGQCPPLLLWPVHPGKVQGHRLDPALFDFCFDGRDLFPSVHPGPA